MDRCRGCGSSQGRGRRILPCPRPPPRPPAAAPALAFSSAPAPRAPLPSVPMPHPPGPPPQVKKRKELGFKDLLSLLVTMPDVATVEEDALDMHRVYPAGSDQRPSVRSRMPVLRAPPPSREHTARAALAARRRGPLELHGALRRYVRRAVRRCPGGMTGAEVAQLPGLSGASGRARWRALGYATEWELLRSMPDVVTLVQDTVEPEGWLVLDAREAVYRLQRRSQGWRPRGVGVTAEGESPADASGGPAVAGGRDGGALGHGAAHGEAAVARAAASVGAAAVTAGAEAVAAGAASAADDRRWEGDEPGGDGASGDLVYDGAPVACTPHNVPLLRAALRLLGSDPTPGYSIIARRTLHEAQFQQRRVESTAPGARPVSVAFRNELCPWYLPPPALRWVHTDFNSYRRFRIYVKKNIAQFPQGVSLRRFMNLPGLHGRHSFEGYGVRRRRQGRVRRPREGPRIFQSIPASPARLRAHRVFFIF